MSKRRFVNGIECRKLLTDMAQKKAFLTVTNRQDNIWRVYKSHFVSVRGNQLVLAQPVPDTADCHLEPAPGQEVAISFKKGYNKYLFLSRVIKADHYEIEPGHRVPVLNIYAPDHIEKIQRRAYNRAEVPADMNVNVKFWLSSQSQSTSACQGKLVNLSAGGAAVEMPVNKIPDFSESEQVTLQFQPLPDHKPVIVSARFRHNTELDNEVVATLGFQFIGLEINEEGRNTLRRLSRAVGVYHRSLPIAEHNEAAK